MAEIVDVLDVATAIAFTEKNALVDPLGTVTLAGTIATDVLLLVSVTVDPPIGAAALKLTVPEVELPPTDVKGFSVTDVSVGSVAVKTRFADTVVPL